MSVKLSAEDASFLACATEVDPRVVSSMWDAVDYMRDRRKGFCIPTVRNLCGDLGDEEESKGDGNEGERPCVYLCGNSLGLQPTSTRKFVLRELDKWASKGVMGHFEGDLPWVSIEKSVQKLSADLVGAKEEEVAVMNSLTCNIHFLLVSLYRPVGARVKILIEASAFGSDYIAVATHLQHRGQDPKEAIVAVKPSRGEFVYRTEDFLEAMEKERDSIACVLLGAVNYLSGQLLDVPAITKKAHEIGATVIFDCAHAAGNVPLSLHDWGVDGACWCSYKYLNAGPGGIAGLFIHEKHTEGEQAVTRLAGWWAHNGETRFRMEHTFDPLPGAAGFQCSNPPVLQTVALLASLEIFRDAGGLKGLRQKTERQAVWLAALVKDQLEGVVDAITPVDLKERGCQLSLAGSSSFGLDFQKVCQRLEKRGVVVDFRKPNMIRAAPTPLYNTYEDCWRFVEALKRAVAEELRDIAGTGSKKPLDWPINDAEWEGLKEKARAAAAAGAGGVAVTANGHTAS
mmetsp:Transcript_25064/g.49028  ORF Transcript_25064/g.49028 Transcript_25064/m.49028 type:complete len:513 (-) Transcript_25064:440-1978(-)